MNEQRRLTAPLRNESNAVFFFPLRLETTMSVSINDQRDSFIWEEVALLISWLSKHGRNELTNDPVPEERWSFELMRSWGFPARKEERNLGIRGCIDRWSGVCDSGSAMFETWTSRDET